MEIVPFPKLKISLESKYESRPIVIKFKKNTIRLPKGNFYIEHQIESLQDFIEIEFWNFHPMDSLQSVLVNIFHNNDKKDTGPLCTFEMTKNSYVKNENKDSYNTIFFNGILKMTFFKQWFECHILKGTQILNQKNLPVQWPLKYYSNHLRFDEDKKNYDIVCLGCSCTYGMGLENNQTWPYILGQKTNSQVANLGVIGAGIDSILKQYFFFKRNMTAKQIYILLPNIYRKRIKFYFGDTPSEYLHTINSQCPSYFDKNFIKKIERGMVDHGLSRAKKIIRFLEKQKNVKLSSWDNETYDILDPAKRLPQYVVNDKVSSLRASDGRHPHTKHNEHFVNLLGNSLTITDSML